MVGVAVGVYDIHMIVLCGSSVALLMKDEACDDDLLLFSCCCFRSCSGSL